MANKYERIARGECGKAYGHVAGHQFHDVIVTVLHRDTADGDRLRVVAVEKWGSCQGRDRDEVRGSKRVSVTNHETLKSAMRAHAAEARQAGFPGAYLSPAISEAAETAEDWLEGVVGEAVAA